MKRIFLLIFVLAALGAAFACGDGKSAGAATPTEAYKQLYAAVKAKDTEAIKANLSKKTLEFAKMAAELNKTPGEEVFRNGMTETTMSETLPRVRDERINGNMGALEVWNSKESRWDDLFFILEDGTWKLAIGDAFAGTYVLPGKGRSEIEKEAANALAPPVQTTNLNANVPRGEQKVPGPSPIRNAK